MKQDTFIFACLCSAAAIALVSAVPVPASNQELDVLQIPLTNGKEIDVLTVGAKDQEQIIAERNKRTIGLLRELFPDITKEIDSIVNRIIAQVIRVVGPSLLPALVGNRPQTTSTNNFDVDFDDDDDDDGDVSGGGNDLNEVVKSKDSAKSNSDAGSVRVKIDLPTFPPSTVVTTTTPITDNKVSSTTTKSSTIPTTNMITSTTSTSTTTTTSTTTSIPTIMTTTTSRIPDEPMTTIDSILNLNEYTKPSPNIPRSITTPKTLSTYTSSYPNIQDTTTLTPNNTNTTQNPTAATTDETTSKNFNNSQENSSESIDVDEIQLVAIIANLNRLLNSTNYFITTRDKLSTTTTTTTPTTTSVNTTTSSLSTTATMPTPTATTVKITKLYPNGATDTQIDLSAINKQLEETIRVARQVKEAEAAASQAQQQTPPQLPIPQSPAKPLPEQTIQLSFNNEVSPLTTNDNSKAINNDLRLSESKSPAIDELTLDSNEDTADLDDRNKRFLSFGGAGLAGGSSGGSGNAGGSAGGAPGGSGNFLFDIVRLFSGSVQTQTGDEAANSANSVSGSSDTDSDSDANRAADGYTEGIPGPVTRLVVLANRGLANLIQDLILRIAATSEKFVNFKAKLITALI